MSSWINAITDRTAIDVAYAQANRASAEPLKGARNASDLNRIANNSMYLRDLLVENGYVIPTLKQRMTEWTRTESPNTQDIQNIIDDIAALRNGFIAIPEPIVPILPINTYQKMNDIEKILSDIKNLMESMPKNYLISGMFSAGGNRIRQKIRTVV